jgi:hypothetical protein
MAIKMTRNGVVLMRTNKDCDYTYTDVLVGEHRAATVTFNVHSNGPTVEINWSAWGEQAPVTALMFAAAIKEAVVEADDLMNAYWRHMEEGTPS